MKKHLDLIIDIAKCAAILLLMIWIFVSCKSTEQIEAEKQQEYNNAYQEGYENGSLDKNN